MNKAEKEQEMMAKEQEMIKMKEENEKLKILADEKQKIKIVKKYIPTPIPMKKKKSPRAQEVAAAVPSTDYLVHQTYAEQLQKRMRETMLNRVMSDTFG